MRSEMCRFVYRFICSAWYPSVRNRHRRRRTATHSKSDRFADRRFLWKAQYGNTVDEFGPSIRIDDGVFAATIFVHMLVAESGKHVLWEAVYKRVMAKVLEKTPNGVLQVYRVSFIHN